MGATSGDRTAGAHERVAHRCGIEAVAITGDATDLHSVRPVVQAVRARFGRIDVGYDGPDREKSPILLKVSTSGAATYYS